MRAGRKNFQFAEVRVSLLTGAINMHRVLSRRSNPGILRPRYSGLGCARLVTNVLTKEPT
jgi:hypothetical protein